MKMNINIVYRAGLASDCYYVLEFNVVLYERKNLYVVN